MWKINADQRISLNLSGLAWDVIERDKEIYRIESYAGFLCRVFDNYYTKAEASIASTVQRLRDEQCAALERAGVRPFAECQRLSRALTVERQEQLKKLHTGYASDQSRIVRLRDDTCDNIMDEFCAQEEQFYGRPSAYMKAVIEEYCRLRPTDREQIVLKDTFACIRKAIEEGRELKITTHKGNTYLVRPYCLAEDTHATAWYLAGYSRKPGEGVRQGVLASFRVSYLSGVNETDHKATLSAREKKASQEAIRTRGIQFLLYDASLIRVKLTSEGLKKYKRLSTLRPPMVASKGDEYTFCCTQTQAEYYFMRLAGDAKVTDPEPLRQRMAEIYAKANEAYQKTDE